MSTPVPGGQPELTGQVMFYKRPEPLSLEKHRNLGVKQVAAPFSFLKTAHAVPITVSEFGVAATCFPIIFVGPDKTPVAVMGVRQNENEYVDANGQPDPDTYLPAFARRYPFVFASDPKSDKLLLCVSQVFPAGRALQGILGGAARIIGSLFIKLVGAQSGVGENRNEIRLHLEQATGDVEETLFLTLVVHAHFTGSQVHHHRRMARRDAHLAVLAGRNDQIALSGPDLAFGADDVDLDCAHNSTAFGRNRSYCSVLAFSTASSMVPTM